MLAREHRVQAALWSADGRCFAFASADLPAPIPGSTRAYWAWAVGDPAMVVPAAD